MKDYPVDHITTDHNNLIAKVCSKQTNPSMPMLPSISPKVLKKSILNGMKLSQLNSSSSEKVLDVTTGSIIGIREGFTNDDLSPVQTRLVGYNQSNDAPVDFDPLTACPTLAKLHGDAEAFKSKIQERVGTMTNIHDKEMEIPLSTGSLPYGHREPKSNEKIVVLINHYPTLQEYKSLGGNHTARAFRSDGSLRSDTPGLVSASLGQENYLKCYWLDIFMIAFPKDGKPTDVVSEANYAYLEEWWVELVLRPLLKYKDVVLAFCSVGSAEKFAKLVLGGGIEKLQELFAADKGKFISANPNKFVSNVHASAIYEYFMVSLQQKVERHDLFITATKKVITGDVNVAECTFGRDITKTNSAAWEFIQQLWLRLCSLGGTNCCEKREYATILYFILLEEMTPLEALSYLQVEESVEDRNLVVGYLKTVAAQGLAVRMGKGEVFGVDHDDVLRLLEPFAGLGFDAASLLKNAEAFADTHSLFGAKSKLAARIQSDDIDADELNEMAAQLDMDGDALLDKAREFGDNNRSSIQSTNDKKWETQYSDLVVYKEKNKHCRVKLSENNTLASWVYTQRRLYKHFMKNELDKSEGMTAERIAKLKKLDFDWVINAWTEKYDLLVEYKEKYNHCRVKLAENKQLAEWVYSQRKLYKRFMKGETDWKKIGGMSDERIAMLTKLGFEGTSQIHMRGRL